MGKMNYVLIGFILISLIVFSMLYIFSTFSYNISNKHIYIKWKLIRIISFNSRRISIDEIQGIKKFELRTDIFAGAQVWGNLFIKGGVIISLKRGIIKNIYVTPEHPDLFIQEINNLRIEPQE